MLPAIHIRTQRLNSLNLVRARLFFVFLCLQPALFAQTVDTITINGKIMEDSSLYSPAKVNLSPYNADDDYFSTNVNPGGTFTFKVPVTGARLYDVRYRGYSKYLLLTQSEPTVNYVIEADANKVRLMKPTGSVENKAYAVFKQANNSLEESLMGFREAARRNSTGYANKIAVDIDVHNKAMEDLRRQYKSTYAAKVLSYMAALPEINRSQPLLEQVQQHYFDNVDWKNLQLYKTPELDYKLSFYLDNIADTAATGKMDFINRVYERVKNAPGARKELSFLLFNEFLNNLREDYLQTYVTWALAQPFITNDIPVLAAKMQIVSKILPGSPAMDVSGMDPNGKTQNLFSALKENKVTMLLFWESDCSHCRKAMPEFIRLYNTYHKKGFEIFAASMDVDSNKWKQFIRANDLKWINISFEPSSPAHAHYFIQYTPTMVLIDSKGIIFRRFLDVGDLDGAIKQALEK